MKNEWEKSATAVFQQAKSLFFSVLSVLKEGVKHNPFSIMTIALYYQSITVEANQYRTEPGLVAYFPFDEGRILDVSGNNNHANILWKAIPSEDQFGRPYSAFYFNGVDAYISGDASHFPVWDRTTALWFKPDIFRIADDRDRGGVLFGYGGTDIFFQPQHGSSWFMTINNLDTKPNCYEVQSAGRDNQVLYCDETMLHSSSIWHHWAVTVHSEVIRMYIDGNFVESGVFNHKTLVDEADFSIGTCVNYGSAPYKDTNVFYFKGYIDELKIYDYALSDNQVYQLYNATKPITSTPILTKPLIDVLLGLSSSGIGIITILKFLIPRITVYVLSKFSTRTDTPESQVTNAVLAKFWIGCCGLGIISSAEYEKYVNAVTLIIDPPATKGEVRDLLVAIPDENRHNKLGNQTKEEKYLQKSDLEEVNSNEGNTSEEISVKRESKNLSQRSLRAKWMNNELNDRQKNGIKSKIIQELERELLGENTSSCYRFFRSFCCYTEITPKLIEDHASKIAGMVRPLI